MIDKKLKEYSIAGVLAATGFVSVFNTASNSDQKITDVLSNRDEAIVTQMTSADQEITKQISTIVDRFHSLNQTVSALDIIIKNTTNEITSIRTDLRDMAGDISGNSQQLNEVKADIRVIESKVQ